jgi:hypothetical protein
MAPPTAAVHIPVAIVQHAAHAVAAGKEHTVIHGHVGELKAKQAVVTLIETPHA